MISFYSITIFQSYAGLFQFIVCIRKHLSQDFLLFLAIHFRSFEVLFSSHTPYFGVFNYRLYPYELIFIAVHWFIIQNFASIRWFFFQIRLFGLLAVLMIFLSHLAFFFTIAPFTYQSNALTLIKFIHFFSDTLKFPELLFLWFFQLILLVVWSF